MELPTNVIVLHNERGRNDRFTYAKAMYEGQAIFIKKATSPELRLNVRSEQTWFNFMRYVSDNFDNTLSSPKLIRSIDDDTLIFEFIEAPHLSDQNQLEPWQQSLERYVAMLVTLDDAAQQWLPPTPPDGRKRGLDTVNRWYEWLGDNAPRVSRLDEAVSVMNETQGNVQICMQHGDLTPWQIFNDNGHWIIYDGEHAGTDHGRYQDLAYG